MYDHRWYDTDSVHIDLASKCTVYFSRMARAIFLLRGVGIVSLILLLAVALGFVAKGTVDKQYYVVEQKWNTPAFQQRSNTPAFRQRGSTPAFHHRVVDQETAHVSDQSTIHQNQETADPQCLVKKSVMPWPKDTKRYKEMYMVFYGKYIMHILAQIVIKRGWKIKIIPKDSLEGQQKLQNLVSPERFLLVVASSRAYRLDVMIDLAKSKNALISTIGNASRVTGTKQTQLTSFRDQFQSFGCSLEEAAIMPRSFILDNPKECRNFFSYSRKRLQSLWVLKPVAGQGGDGITIHSNLTFFYKEYATCSKQSKYIVQEYVSNPLLLNNRKFDIRAYMLIAKTSPHYLVFYHEGQLRLSSKEFDIHGNRRDVHLTNTHLQTSVEGYTLEDHFWSFQDLQKYLNEHRPEDGRDFVSKTLVPFIQKIGVLVAHSG